MSFNRRTWTDRVSEYPNRRILTDEDENQELVTFTRSEGQISNEGDAFNAENMNDLEGRISNTFGGCQFSVNDNGKPCVSYSYGGEVITKKLGSSEGTATTDQVLAGATFNSANTLDDEDMSAGTMENNSGVTKFAGSVENGETIYLAIPDAGYYDTTSKLAVQRNNIQKPITLNVYLLLDRASDDDDYKATVKVTINGVEYRLDTAIGKGDRTARTVWNITV